MSNAAIHTDLVQAVQLLDARNYPQAELHLRRYLNAGGHDPVAQALMQNVLQGYGMPATFQLSERSVTRAKGAGRYLMIKAWGYGFWSDVHHVLGQLLVAELTQRTPIIQWGSNSLFGDGSRSNAFEHFFEPISRVDLSAQLDQLSIYPPKWTRANLHDDNVNKWSGSYSRQAAQFSFNREEDLVVSDFYTLVSALVPWIAKDSRYFGMSDDDIYIELFAKYIKPLPHILERVDGFHAQHMAGRSWVAVHVRGSDKIKESAGLHHTNQGYFAFIDRISALNPGIGIFLLTDAVDIHQEFVRRYGDRLVTTPALRSSSTTGVHLLGHSGVTVGEEVLTDALLATRCHYFVGNKESNVSNAISSMKRWPQGLLVMLGESDTRAENMFLHATPAVGAALGPASTQPAELTEPCRLCGSPTRYQFSKQVMSQHRVRYVRCTGCQSLQTDKPHWLDQAYAGAAELYDTGKASRTLVNFLVIPPLLDALNVRRSDMAVDFGGGTGLFGRLMRDAGYNFHTCDKYGSSEFMGGYAWSDLDHATRGITLFEVAEHFPDPATEWQRIFATNPDWVLGSTGLYTGQGADWTYLCPESGQHIFFYSHQAISHLAAQAGRHAYDLGMYFLITKTPLDAPTLGRVQRWQNHLQTVCQDSFTAWAQGPYRHATTDMAELKAYASLQQSGKRIAIDGTFFRFQSGIARVWRMLLKHWAATTLAPNLVIIDRGRTAPRLPGLSYVDAPLYDYACAAQDRVMLQSICDRENIGLFISTYYTTPLTTPSALLVLDMIPEIMGFDLNEPQWQGKKHAIEYAKAFLSISQSTQNDLTHFYPGAAHAATAVTHCGCDLRTASVESVQAFKTKWGITQPYFLISGGRADYKNAALFFQAFERLGDERAHYAVVCTNAMPPLEPEFARHVGAAQIHMLALSDDDLQSAYTGAIALAYPSRYEGFGLPVAEAMACQCPVITCHNSSLPEVGGQAVIYVDPDSPEQMHQALLDVQDPVVRAGLIEQGLRQASRFSWLQMSRAVGQHLANWAVTTP